MDQKVDGTRLSGVPETTLWTLHNRAGEAARPDGRIDDPWAVALRDRIDHPYQRSFGKPSQAHPLRARCFDQVMREFLAEHPGGTVVCLGEGLETGFWRITVPQLAQFPQRLPAIATLVDLQLPRGRGLWGWPAPLIGALPVLRAHRPAISLVTFADHRS